MDSKEGLINMLMHKLKLFLDNFIIYGFGGIISKIIPFIMIPVVTKMMPNPSYYGISDLTTTIISFGSALGIMGMYDAMYRAFFDHDNFDYKQQVCSTALLFTTCSSIVVFILMLSFREQLTLLFFNDNSMNYLIYICAFASLVTATNSILSAPTRMQNKRFTFIIINTISPILSYSIALLLIVKEYYIIALPLAAMISGIILELTFYILNHKWFKLKKFRFEILKDLLKLALPLMLNVLCYWIFNFCDRVMISNIIDTNAVGIYAVGSKLGHCSQLIYTAFAGGWQYFAFSTMKEKNQIENNSKVFEYLGVISLSICVIICALSHFIFSILFAEDYLNGFIVAPYLFMAPLLQMLEQVIGNQFLVIKKTWPTFIILGSGATLNVILNYLLIPIMGIEGAALATLSGYVLSVVLCATILLKMKLLIINRKMMIATVLTIIYVIFWRFFYSENTFFGMTFAILPYFW